MSKLYRLRPHHLFNVIKEYHNNYTVLEDGIRNTVEKRNGIPRNIYTESDAIVGPNFYREIVSDHNNIIVVANGIDDRCKICSNYDGKGCTAYTSRKLKLEDTRTLKELPSNSVGNWFYIKDLIK